MSFEECVIGMSLFVLDVYSLGVFVFEVFLNWLFLIML